MLANHFAAIPPRDSQRRDPSKDKPSDIERARTRLGMTQEAFAAYAGVTRRTYERFLSGRHSPNVATRKRLLAASRGTPLPKPNLTLLAAMHKTAMVLFAVELGVDVHDVVTRDFSRAGGMQPRDASYLAAAKVRRLAMYQIVVELGLASSGALARAIGCTKQNVSLALAAIEDLRDEDATIEALINRIAL